MIQAEQSLQPYFKELVENAIYHQHIEVTDLSEFYIVNLLSRFMKTNALFDEDSGRFEEVPLAELLKQALSSTMSNRIKIMKKMGDTSLYIAGYFSDYIDSKSVDIDYYISMGEGAYNNLSGIFAGEKTFSELYGELSIKFAALVNILSEVRNSGKIISNSALIKLYERWLKTGDPLIKEQLQKEGIIPKKME
jgi:hypothetical protein